MLVAKPPRRPRFGATYERLRYDAPISVRDPRTGKFSSMPYEGAGSPSSRTSSSGCPNGSRFVFWRGSSYIPFWAGRHNTGACYEWAEIISQPAGAVDCVEPLMDKELRYSRVEIVESTAARVHVRWSYQSTDFQYKVWGDEAVEDYYFYPDGFGTRVVNLKADPKNDYELSEFIILTPKGPIRSTSCRTTRSTPCSSTAGSTRSDSRTLSAKRPSIRESERRAGDLSAAIQQGRGTRGHLFQPERDEASAGRLRPVFRPGRDGHSVLLGEPLAAGAGELDRPDDRRSRSHSRRLPQQRDELGRHAGPRRSGPRISTPWIPWAGPGR